MLSDIQLIYSIFYLEYQSILNRKLAAVLFSIDVYFHKSVPGCTEYNIVTFVLFERTTQRNRQVNIEPRLIGFRNSAHGTQKTGGDFLPFLADRKQIPFPQTTSKWDSNRFFYSNQQYFERRQLVSGLWPDRVPTIGKYSARPSGTQFASSLIGETFMFITWLPRITFYTSVYVQIL